LATTSTSTAPIKASAGPGLTLSRLAIRVVVVIGVLIMVVPLLMTAYMSLFADGVVVFPPSGYTLSWYGRLNEFPGRARRLSRPLGLRQDGTAWM
jgi:putative spermidine/putrescine transport system permease protein